MVFSRLIIDQELPIIGTKLTPAKLNITTNTRRITSVETEYAKPEITNTDVPAFELDFAALMSDVGVKLPSEYAEANLAKNRNHALEATKQIAADGNHLAAVDKGGNRIKDVINRRSQAPNQREYNIANIPSHLPDLKWEKQSLSVEWSDHSVKVEWSDDIRPSIELEQRANVEVFFRNQPKITMTVEEYPGISSKEI